MAESSLRQRILRYIYPLFVFSKSIGKKKMFLQNKALIPPHSHFHSLSFELINGKRFPMENVKGKKVMIVNTASNCGYTPQYAELQKLYQHSREDLEIIAFPSNDFKEQESGNNDEIAGFCSSVYAIRFPLAGKSHVTGEHQNEIFRWLTDKDRNGWNDKMPSWNFSKYLINEKGILTHYFEPAVSPLSSEVLRAINE